MNSIYLSLANFFFLWQPWVWVMLPSSFCFSYFSNNVSHFFARMGLRPQSAHLCLPSNWDYRRLDGFSLSFCLGWHPTMCLPISASHVAVITDMCHCTWLSIKCIGLKSTTLLLYLFSLYLSFGFHLISSWFIWTPIGSYFVLLVLVLLYDYNMLL
jgi:hypothetical protein